MITRNSNKIKNKILKKIKMNSETFKNKNYPNLITDYNSNEKIYSMSCEFEEKVKKFIKAPKNIAIITDFDFTLTKKYHHDSNCYSSYCVLEFSDHISDNFRKINQDLFQKYAKFENDLTLDFHTRDELVKTWFRDNLDLIVDEKLIKENFQAMVLKAEKKFFYRYGILELFDLVHTHNIPIFIISGGIYEIIEESLKIILPYFQELVDKKLIHILSNKFTYDQNGKISGYEEPFVYTFNKGEILKKIYHEYNLAEGNLIVMGDHLNDTDTIRHIDYNEEIKIGFINYFEDSLTEQQIKMIEAYQLKYDVCLINDGNLTFINNLIKQILSGFKVGSKDDSRI